MFPGYSSLNCQFLIPLNVSHFPFCLLIPEFCVLLSTNP